MRCHQQNALWIIITRVCSFNFLAKSIYCCLNFIDSDFKRFYPWHQIPWLQWQSNNSVNVLARLSWPIYSSRLLAVNEIRFVWRAYNAIHWLTKSARNNFHLSSRQWQINKTKASDWFKNIKSMIMSKSHQSTVRTQPNRIIKSRWDFSLSFTKIFPVIDLQMKSCKTV